MVLIDALLLIPRLFAMGLVKMLESPAAVFGRLGSDLATLPKIIGSAFRNLLP